MDVSKDVKTDGQFFVDQKIINEKADALFKIYSTEAIEQDDDVLNFIRGILWTGYKVGKGIL